MKTPLSTEEIELVFRMCGRVVVDAEFTTDIFNLLLQKGMKADLMDAVIIRAKHHGKLGKFKHNSNNFRTYFKYKRQGTLNK